MCFDKTTKENWYKGKINENAKERFLLMHDYTEVWSSDSWQSATDLEYFNKIENMREEAIYKLTNPVGDLYRLDGIRAYKIIPVDLEITDEELEESLNIMINEREHKKFMETQKAKEDKEKRERELLAKLKKKYEE